MIKIKTNNIHLTEKKYILSVIFEDILGVEYSHEICDRNVYEIILANNKNNRPGHISIITKKSKRMGKLSIP